MTRLSTFAIVSLVALRLFTGWHFFNEGVKKLEPGFSSAGFLRAAKGPLGPLFHSMVKGPYDAYALLGEPHEQGTRPDGEGPADPWVAKIETAWDEGQTRLGRLGVGGETADQLSALRDSHLEEIKQYLKDESDAIGELQHEAWRLEGMKKKAGRSPAPFQADRIAEKESEVWRTMQPWIKTVEGLQDDYFESASTLLSDTGLSAERVKAALSERSLLGWVDFLVTATVLICGVCLFFGFATRLAAIVAAGFLVSLVMMQPPWAGVEMKEFFFWTIEIAAFGVIAALGAGQWAGIDGLFGHLRSRSADAA